MQEVASFIFVMEDYGVKICKSKFLSQQVGKLTLGLDYKEKLLLDSDYFDCCKNSGSLLDFQTNRVSMCDLRPRFSYTVELLKEYSDLFELKESYLFYESQNVDILFFHKIYQSIINNNVGALLFTGSGVGEHSRSMLPDNVDLSIMSFFYGLALSWRFGFRVHYLRVDRGSFFSKRYPSISSMSWGSFQDKRVLFVCVSNKASLTDTAVLESAINFCYNSRTFLVILDDREISQEDKKEEEKKTTSANPLTGRSYFSRRISKIKSRPLLAYLDPSCQSKLRELLATS